MQLRQTIRSIFLVVFLTALCYGDGFLVGTNELNLLSLDPSDGSVSNLGSLSVPGGSKITGLAYNESESSLYAYESRTGLILSYSLVDGNQTTLGSLGTPIAGGSELAFDPNTNLLFATGIRATVPPGFPLVQTLYTFDPATGQSTPIGDLNDQIIGLTFDPSTNILYGASNSSKTLYTIDQSNAVLTALGTLGFGVPAGVTSQKPRGKLIFLES